MACNGFQGVHPFGRATPFGKVSPHLYKGLGKLINVDTVPSDPITHVWLAPLEDCYLINVSSDASGKVGGAVSRGAS